MTAILAIFPYWQLLFIHWWLHLAIHPSIWPGIHHLMSVFLQTRQKCMKTRGDHYYRESQNRHLFIISLSSASGEEKLQGVPLTHKKGCCAETRNLNKGCIRKSLVSTLPKFWEITSFLPSFSCALFYVELQQTVFVASLSSLWKENTLTCGLLGCHSWA